MNSALIVHAMLTCEVVANSAREGYIRTKRVNQFLHAVVPVVDMYHRITVLGWLKDRNSASTNSHDFLVSFYFAQTVFETFFRTVASVLGNTILERNPNPKGGWNFVYKMVSRDEDGLGSRSIVDQICECLPVGDRSLAATTIEYAIRLRDAMSHGAVMKLSAVDRFGVFNVYWKSAELLCEACETQFVREAAFAKYAKRGYDQHGHDKEDWNVAELEIDELLRKCMESPGRQSRWCNLNLILPNDWRFCPT